MKKPLSDQLVRQEWGRLVDVLLHPVKAFDDIRVRPGWIVPVTMVTLVGTLHIFLVSHSVGMEQALQNEYDISQNDLDMRDSAAMFASAGIFYILIPLGYLVSIVMTAAVLTGLFGRLRGGSLGFRHSIAIASYANLPFFASTLLTMLILPLLDPAEVDLDITLGLGAALLLQESTNSPELFELASSINVFSIWSLLLVAVGVSTVTQTVTLRTSILILAPLWSVLLVVEAWVL